MRSRTAEIAALITAESGLCIKDSTYEAGRVADVLTFGAGEVLKDDGQIFSCDLTPHGKKRRVYTQRDPLLGVISAITPFNHPMNQVAHKIVPSVATNNRIVVKPSEKVPLSCYLFADILYEAGLPPQMLQVLTGDPKEIADELITNPAIDLITFTGGVSIGKSIASRMGYRRAVLELGGNDPIIVMEDADLDEASTLAVSAVQELGPALHRDQADARARVGGRSLYGTRGRENACVVVRQSVRSVGRHGHGDRRGRREVLRAAGARRNRTRARLLVGNARRRAVADGD